MIWTLIAIVTLISALIVHQELADSWKYWRIGGRTFFNNLNYFAPQNDNFEYPNWPAWELKLGSIEIDINYYPKGDIRDSIGDDYSPIIFKLGKFYIVIWS